MSEFFNVAETTACYHSIPTAWHIEICGKYCAITIRHKIQLEREESRIYEQPLKAA